MRDARGTEIRTADIVVWHKDGEFYLVLEKRWGQPSGRWGHYRDMSRVKVVSVDTEHDTVRWVAPWYLTVIPAEWRAE